MKAPTIERSAGTPARFASGALIPTALIPGGGYSGATASLDQAVQKAAQALAELTGFDIEIRFNSHRKSGGAYLKGIDGTIGIGARQASATEKVTCDVYCAKEHLRNSKLANFETHSYRTFRSLNAALRWLKSHVCLPQHA
jgi:hypothetical protein